MIGRADLHIDHERMTADTVATRPASAKPHIPCLGITLEQVWKAWKSDPGDATGLGVRETYAYDVDQSREFFFTPSGKLNVAITGRHCTPLCRDATDAEVSMLVESLKQGRVQIYRRGRRDGYADRGLDYLELHRATARPLLGEPSS
ncbi:MAG: hypothetical protein C0522_13855 [Rhodocyclaceae bacterium]|nr:hypothetical protein [Rhodocyclaceae bacterium]